MHSATERAKKHVPVYTALDWHSIFCNARRDNPYKVEPMMHKDFVDLKQLSVTVGVLHVCCHTSSACIYSDMIINRESGTIVKEY